jgi:hypothetical protein
MSGMQNNTEQKLDSKFKESKNSDSSKVMSQKSEDEENFISNNDF